MSNIDISIVIPAYNEGRNIILLSDKLVKVMKKIGRSYEVILIDDGSKDSTFNSIISVCKKYSSFKGIRFMKNFKKSAAYMAGFNEAKGNIIITMDADLQDDPDEIPNLLDALKYKDLIVGWKINRQDSLFFKKIPSKIFNYLNYKLFGVKLHDNDCGFRAMKSCVAKELNLYGDLYRYIPALVSRLGYSVGEIRVIHHKRRFGKSKYGNKRIITGTLDLLTVKFLTDFNQRPLHLFGGMGLISFSLGFLAELYVLYFRIFQNELFAVHLPMLILGVLLIILGVQLLGIGLLGELISSSRKEVKRYRVKEVLN